MADPPSAPVEPAPKAMPATRAFAWFHVAMDLFRRAPWQWCVLGALTLLSRFGLELIPGIGRAAAEVVVPVIECGLLIGAVRVDRGDRLELKSLLAAFRAPPAALAAIVLSSLIVSAVEFSVAYALADVNLLDDPGDPRLTAEVLLAVIATTTLVSLPLAFVPFAALFERRGFVRSFTASLQGFWLNAGPLLLFGLISLALTLVGVLTYWIGLVAVYPLLAGAGYAAWRDVFPRPLESIKEY
jgi:hypothetical protein